MSGLERRPVQRVDARLVHEVTDRVRDLIRRGDLAPGAHLHQGVLADALGVSRTPVREALLRLEQEGLVLVEPGRGRFVKQVSLDEVRQINEFREHLEPVAASLGCARASQQQRDAVWAAQLRHEELALDSEEEKREATLEMHRLLTAPCGNRMMLDVLESLWVHQENRSLFSANVPDAEHAHQVVDEHRRIAEAFLAGKDELVGDLMRQHVRTWGLGTG